MRTIPFSNQKATQEAAVIASFGNHKNLPIVLNDDSFGANTKQLGGKSYPGAHNFATYRVMARNSTPVSSIITLRTQQVAMLPYKIIPNKKEPAQQVSILKYSTVNLRNHPAFDDSEKIFIEDLFDRLDPDGTISDKRKEFSKRKSDFSDYELEYLEILERKHADFYKKRQQNIAKIKTILDCPDKNFSDTRTWKSFIVKIIEDILILDRGCFYKIRDSESGELVGLMPVDGATIKPLATDFGFADQNFSYCQYVNGKLIKVIPKDDISIIMMNPKTDVARFGYGTSPMETLYTTVLTDLFIDKGNLDYYRKGGSIPEIIINVEPPVSKDGTVLQFGKDKLDALQRQLQSIMLGDFTQVPLVAGAKLSVVDLKGKRKDMQFKELADATLRKICAVMQVSPQDVSMLADVNRSSGQVQAEMTKSKGLTTLMTTISEAITSEVINEIRPEKDLYLWFEDADSEKRKAEWYIYQQQLTVGYVSVNEVRNEWEGRPPVPWGDTPLNSGNRDNWRPPKEDEEDKGNPLAFLGLGGGQESSSDGLPSIPNLDEFNSPSGASGGANPFAGRPNQNEVTKSLESSYRDEDIANLMDAILSNVNTVEIGKAKTEIQEYISKSQPSAEYLKVASMFGKHYEINNVDETFYDKDNVFMLSEFDGKYLTVGKDSTTPFISILSTDILKSWESEFSYIREEDRKDLVELSLTRLLPEDMSTTLKSMWLDYKGKIFTQEEIDNTLKVLERVYCLT